MNTIQEKLLTELKSSPITTNVYGEIKTIIDEDLRTALFDLLSQPTDEPTPIKLGDRFLTQEEFNRMYTHYSDLCDKEDTNGWWENQFCMANSERDELQKWKESAIQEMKQRDELMEGMALFIEKVQDSKFYCAMTNEGKQLVYDLLTKYNNLSK